MSTLPPPALRAPLERLQRGDELGARELISAALADDPASVALLELAALLAARAGDEEQSLGYNQAILAIDRLHPAARINVVRSLMNRGCIDEALAACDDSSEPKIRRLRAFLHQQRGNLTAALVDYRAVVSAFPDDYESWNNLGNVNMALNDAAAAASAYDRAVQLRPDQVSICLNLSDALARTERFEARRRLMRRTANYAPANSHVQTELGLSEAAMRDFVAAERAYRRAIELDGAVAAFVELGLLLENLNRIDELATLVEEAERRNLPEGELGFLKAWLIRRQGRPEEALPLAQKTPETLHPLRRHQLVAELHDRVGNTEDAFAAFRAMNEIASALAPPTSGPSYLARITASGDLLTPAWVAGWSKITLPAIPSAPVFIVGFPRSGTTLLDTLLMNLPQFHVLEELPLLREATAHIGDDDRVLATLTSLDAQALRDRYFGILQTKYPMSAGQTVVDKNPLHMTRMALIHRIFPDARVVFVQRHPCDVVLSCYMANFQLNTAMRSFVTLEETAQVYHAALTAWTRARALLPIDVHVVRYEEMVSDLEHEMRPLLGFLGANWDAAVLDNRASAAKREHIRTASYSQVTEPIYRRAAGRWERYRSQLEPVLPILAPWAAAMGYEM